MGNAALFVMLLGYVPTCRVISITDPLDEMIRSERPRGFVYRYNVKSNSPSVTLNRAHVLWLIFQLLESTVVFSQKSRITFALLRHNRHVISQSLGSISRN